MALDIGAHIGYYTRVLGKLAGAGGAVYAFEPSLENFRLLEKNCAKTVNAKLHNLAVGDKTGEINLYVFKSSQSFAFSSLPESLLNRSVKNLARSPFSTPI